MKIIKYIFIAIGILALIFFGNGFNTKSIDYECQIEVNKPAKECWNIMSDESKMSNWLEGFKRIELVSGKANTVGSVSNVFFEENGEEMVMQETITSIKENEHMAMTFTMDFMNMDYEMKFTENDSKTLITTLSSTQGNGLFANSILSFMGSDMEAQELKNLENLKKLIEKGN